MKESDLTASVQHNLVVLILQGWVLDDAVVPWWYCDHLLWPNHHPKEQSYRDVIYYKKIIET